MYNLTKKEKLDFILRKIREMELTAYDIGKKTKLSVSGVEKIINGTVKNPQENTVDKILLFLENKVLGSELNKVEEPIVVYEKSGFDINKYISCMETEKKLTKEIHRLQGILRKNNINFSDYFENESQ